MKKVLVPIDFSENSLNALHYGQLLFKDVECTFYVITSYMVKQSKLLGDQLENERVESLTRGVKEDLNKVIDDKKKQNLNSKHYFEGISESELLIPSITNCVAKFEIDFIVIGTKGAKGLKEIFLGSNAVRVLNAVTECPTIVVPHDYLPKKVTQVVFSTNYKRAFSEQELTPLLSLLKYLNATLKIIQIMEDTVLTETQNKHKSQLIELLQDIPLFIHKISFDTSETEAIRDFVKETKSDMISLIHHKHNFFYELTNENVVEKVSFDSPVPLLVLPTVK